MKTNQEHVHIVTSLVLKVVKKTENGKQFAIVLCCVATVFVIIVRLLFSMHVSYYFPFIRLQARLPVSSVTTPNLQVQLVHKVRKPRKVQHAYLKTSCQTLSHLIIIGRDIHV